MRRSGPATKKSKFVECQRALFAFGGSGILLLITLRWLLSDVQWSGFWRTDCSAFAHGEDYWEKESPSILSNLRERISTGNIQFAEHPRLCIAIPTATREHSYLLQTVTSLLGGLSDTELSDLRVKVLDSENVMSDAFHGLSPLVQRVSIAQSHVSQVWRKQETLDYISAMESCLDSPLALILEDDTHATRHAVQKILQAVQEVGSRSDKWLLLKLFQPVWGNVDYDWGEHCWTLIFVSATMGCIIGMSTRSLWPLSLQTGQGCGAWCLGCMLLCTFSLVAAGKPTLDVSIGRLGRGLSGLNLLLFENSPAEVSLVQVGSHGTCHMSQANLFNTDRSMDLIDYLRAHAETDIGVDLQICRFFADPAWATDHTEWSSEPSLFQHVGRFSSGGLGKNQGDCTALHQSATWSSE